MAPECAVATMAQAGKYLSFRLDDEEYGLEILKVQEIVSAAGINEFPRNPENVRGRIRLRSRDIPVIDMRGVFGLKAVLESEKSCIIIAQVSLGSELITMGLLVDEVCDVLNIAAEEIQFPPTWAGGMEGSDFINGLGKLEDRDVILLESEKIFSEEELKAVVLWDD
ncbi:MAG: chemotaxis protein CheW [Candidatus Krumholzibacteriota bacterium]